MSAPASLPMNSPNAAMADPLASLRGYHLPEPVSWWPPAPGWWVLALVILLAGAALIWWALRRHRRRAAARQALGELGVLRESLATGGDKALFVRELSKLLRRYALAVFPQREVAALTGAAWLDFLDRHGGNGRFSSELGQQLAAAPYRPQVQVAAEELAALVGDWIRHNREVRAC